LHGGDSALVLDVDSATRVVADVVRVTAVINEAAVDEADRPLGRDLQSSATYAS